MVYSSLSYVNTGEDGVGIPPPQPWRKGDRGPGSGKGKKRWEGKKGEKEEKKKGKREKKGEKKRRKKRKEIFFQKVGLIGGLALEIHSDRGSGSRNSL